MIISKSQQALHVLIVMSGKTYFFKMHIGNCICWKAHVGTSMIAMELMEQKLEEEKKGLFLSATTRNLRD